MKLTYTAISCEYHGHRVSWKTWHLRHRCSWKMFMNERVDRRLTRIFKRDTGATHIAAKQWWGIKYFILRTFCPTIIDMDKRIWRCIRALLVHCMLQSVGLSWPPLECTWLEAGCLDWWIRVLIVSGRWTCMYIETSWIHQSYMSTGIVNLVIFCGGLGWRQCRDMEHLIHLDTTLRILS